jgi:hypothetical protein
MHRCDLTAARTYFEPLPYLEDSFLDFWWPPPPDKSHLITIEGDSQVSVQYGPQKALELPVNLCLGSSFEPGDSLMKRDGVSTQDTLQNGHEPDQLAAAAIASNLFTATIAHDRRNSPLVCPHSKCDAISFSHDQRLAQHVARNHTKPLAYQHCEQRFGVVGDLNRHLRTVHKASSSEGTTRTGAWICREDGCVRNERPFSRHNNYLKHMRAVHGYDKDRTKGRRRKETSVSDDSGGSANRDPELLQGKSSSKVLGKRRAEEMMDGDENLESEDESHGLSRRELVAKCHRLENELLALRRRHEEREDKWLRLLTANMRADGRPAG